MLCSSKKHNFLECSSMRDAKDYAARSVLSAAAESSSIYIIIMCSREDDQPPPCHYLTTDLRDDPTMPCFIFRPLHMIPTISYHPTIHQHPYLHGLSWLRNNNSMIIAINNNKIYSGRCKQYNRVSRRAAVSISQYLFNNDGIIIL